jgi:4-hydroxy-3-methylbut-2-en-1-yl diphosphate reductase
MPPHAPITIELASPRGFCAGVERAIAIVERALQLHGAPIYVRHEVVHNRYVVENLRQAGAIFIESLDEVPTGATLIFSAHGVPRQVVNEAEARGLRIFDATCPLVTRVHQQVIRHARHQHEVILIGHAGHPEVEGTMGQYTEGPAITLVESEADVATLEVNDATQLAYVTQTTLSVDDTRAIVAALRRRFPLIQGPKGEDICYATQNRQDAIKTLARRCEVVLVVGSPNSSNSNRLREVAMREGARAYLIDNASEIDAQWLAGVTRIGLSAGASAPEILVQEVIDHLTALGAQVASDTTPIDEGVHFTLPKELRQGNAE